MKDSINNTNESSSADNLKRMNFSPEDESSKENPIPASDHSRNDERDKRIGEEEDTARLRSERESVEQANKE